MNEEKKLNRKDLIKNIAIIFLSIMLVLTFFSNTIMNYSLPQVATDVVEPGSVTTKIRGTGTLAADDPYKVTIQESRVIASVAVKEGDLVEKGQVLFYLEDKESEELKKAEAELEDMIQKYTTSLLAGEISQESYQNIQSGNISSANTYQARINEAKLRVENAQATVDSLARQIAIAGTTSSAAVDKQAELDKAKTALSNAESNRTSAESSKTSAESKLNDAQARYDALGSESELTNAKNEKVKVENEKKQAYEVGKGAFQDLLNIELGKVGGQTVTVADYSTKSDRNAYDGELSKIIEDSGLDKNATNSDNKTVPDLLKEMRQSYEDYLTAVEERKAAEKSLSEKQSLAGELSSLRNTYNEASNHYNDASNYYNECKALVDRLQNELTDGTNSSTKQKADLERAKIDADAALTQAKADLTQLLTDVGKELDLSNQSELISEKQKEVAKLREKSTGTTIEAPVAGMVSSITKTAGETTTPDEALATMQPEGKGYTMSFSVTNEQAKKVSVGEVAELQNAWYYDEVKATLTGIRPDTENPGQKKLLTFTVDGNVQAGQSISLSIGQKSANYDFIVPNSAVREDNNGKFILIVEVRNSPLGNRYVATRVDVEVLAADDINTAISAALYGHEYVITTATKPVEAGKQVRLADE